jgi:hypothetical protein
MAWVVSAVSWFDQDIAGLGIQTGGSFIGPATRVGINIAG